jgi:hypothetical protein
MNFHNPMQSRRFLTQLFAIYRLEWIELDWIGLDWMGIQEVSHDVED